jgi:hypothetical protein
VPLNVIDLLEKQRNLFDCVFVPSDIAIGLLFPRVSDAMKQQLFEYCKKQFCNGFKLAIDSIRQRLRYTFPVVSYNGRINVEFTDEVQKHISLPPEARLRDYEFRLRYGEELLLWANKYVEIIDNRGLKFSDQGSLVLVCKENKIITYHEGAD